MSAIVIPSEYGYVLGVAIVSTLHLITLSAKVCIARFAADIPYPYAYVEKAEAEKDPKKNDFNCAQHNYQHSLELFPVYITALIIGGLKHPNFATICAFVFLLERLVFAINHSSGKPKKHLYGGFSYLGLLGLLSTSVSTVYEFLK